MNSDRVNFSDRVNVQILNIDRVTILYLFIIPDFSVSLQSAV